MGRSPPPPHRSPSSRATTRSPDTSGAAKSVGDSRGHTSGITVEDEHARLQTVEVELDRCWDPLRQRRAKREFGEDPDIAEVRSERTVEGYTG
ncbi:MAG: DUF2630 family protein [Humibacillus sp.]